MLGLKCFPKSGFIWFSLPPSTGAWVGRVGILSSWRDLTTFIIHFHISANIQFFHIKYVILFVPGWWQWHFFHVLKTLKELQELKSLMCSLTYFVRWSTSSPIPLCFFASSPSMPLFAPLCTAEDKSNVYCTA